MAFQVKNDVLSNIGQEVKNTVTHKRAGFYVGLASAVLTVVQAVLYKVSYGSTAYYDPLAVALAIVGVAVFVVASLSHYSSPYASVVLAACNFVGLLLFINASYMYLADVFYGGINAASFAALRKDYVACILLSLVATIAANVAVYLKQDNVVAAQIVEDNADQSQSFADVDAAADDQTSEEGAE